MPRGRAETFLARLGALDLPTSMRITLLPLRSVIEVLDEEIVRADEECEALVAADPMVKQLTTLPGIGPITATAFGRHSMWASTLRRSMPPNETRTHASAPSFGPRTSDLSV